MRILVLTPTFLPAVGGAELIIFEIYRRLAQRHQIYLVTPTLSEELLRDQASEEYESLVPFPIYRFHDSVTCMKIPGHRWSGGALPPFSISAIFAIQKACRDFHPDVLNVHYLMPTGLAAFCAEKFFNIPTVVTMNGRDIPGPDVPWLWQWWQRALLAGISNVTYVSSYARNAIFGSGSQRGTVIYNGVEIPPPPGDGKAVRTELGIPSEEPMIFALQRLGPEKRVDVLLRAFQHSRRQTGSGVLVIGGKGPEKNRLQALTRSLDIEKYVYFVGYISNQVLPSYFLACEIFAFHSTFETFGVVVAQAMSYGRPVVTVRNTALPEVLGDGGVLVETGDHEAFGDAMARLVQNKDLQARLGEAGRLRTATHYNLERIVEQYEAVLTQAVAERQHAH